jgi:kinesin family protein 12
MIVSNDNNALQIKLENLEQLFIKNSTSGKKNISKEYMNCNLIAENKMIRNKIIEIED